MDDAYHIHHGSHALNSLSQYTALFFKWTSPQTVYSVVLLLYKYELIRTRWIHVYE